MRVMLTLPDVMICKIVSKCCRDFFSAAATAAASVYLPSSLLAFSKPNSIRISLIAIGLHSLTYMNFTNGG